MKDPFNIEKSSRHSKIIGQFGEAFLCNWLSRSGFEVTIVDHTGLDIIAYNRATHRRLGITVKARTRNPGKEAESVSIFPFSSERVTGRLVITEGQSWANRRTKRCSRPRCSRCRVLQRTHALKNARVAAAER